MNEDKREGANTQVRIGDTRVPIWVDFAKLEARVAALEARDHPCPFKENEPVLVRVGPGNLWNLRVFTLYMYHSPKPYITRNSDGLGASEWEECIPYAGNEHLLGTSTDPDKEN